MKRLFVLLLLVSSLGYNSYSQLSITSSGTNYVVDFDNTLTGVNNGQYSGSGFQTTPSTGQLDSDAWAVEGMSDGDVNFGGSGTSGDFARGTRPGGVSTGGFYAFVVASGNNTFGIQPGGSDWTSGNVTLKIQNNTGGMVSSLSLSYCIYYYNDQGRANSFNFSHSADDISYTSVSSLNFTSPQAASGSPSWQYVDRNITITGLNVVDGGYYYLRWTGDDVSGSGSRDEFGLDDITINVKNESDIIKKSGWSEPQNIAYLSYLAASGLTASNSIETGSFTIRDGAGTNDSDAFSTTLTDITFEIDKFENIQAIAIFDGSTNVSEITTVNATVNFSSLTLEAPDGGEMDFSIYVTFKTTVTDKENLKFTITSATANPSGSVFADTDAGGAETDNTGNNNKIVVTADRLAINTPSTVYVNNNFTVLVSSVDINNNTDLDETSGVTLVRNSGSGNLTSLTGLSQSLNNGTRQWTDLQYNIAEVFRIEAQSAGLINIISNNITATSSPYIDLIISEIADPETPNGNAKFVEIYNAGNSDVNFSTETWYLSKEANAPDGVWCDVPLTGSITSGGVLVIANKEITPPVAFYNAYGFEADQYNGCVRGNGNDSYYLYYGGDHESGTLIDAFGEQGVNGTGTLWEYKDSKATRKRHITSPNSTWTASEWVIIPATAAEMTPKWHDKALTWNGGSKYWYTAANWTDGGSNATYPPDAGCDLTIENLTNNPEISGRASCNNMTIESGAVVTVKPDYFLVTGSQITNNTGTNGLIVESDDQGDGMLLLGTGTVQATVKRYLTDDMSHFISAPITDATADNLFQDHNPEVYLYERIESDNSWQYLVPTSTPMPNGKGFSSWVDDDDDDYITADFDGTLMSANLTLNSSSTPSLEYTDNSHGWNLVGNPYPVPLDWTRGSWDLTNVEGTIYIWDPDANTSGDADGSWVWKTITGAGTSGFNVIPGGQAFLVRTQGSNPSLTIPADARSVYYNQAYYKSSREDNGDSSTYQADYIIVKAINDMDEDEVWISFNEYGTEDFDNGWDATKLNNSYNTLSVYIPKETRNQCLEHLPSLLPDEERIVEMNFETTVDGEHSMAIDMTYLPNTNVTLEDLKYNQTQDMKYDSIYSFVAFTDDDPNRFRIHFNKTTTGIEFQEFDHKTDQSVQIYSHDKNIYIKKEDVNSSGYVMVYDLYGREVLSQPLENTSLMKIPVHLNNTYLIVKVISDSKVTTSKVYIR